MTVSERSGEFRYRPTGPFGVAVEGDLATLPGSGSEAWFAELFREHGLIIARGQSLHRAQHDALLALLGAIIPHRAGETGVMHSEPAEGRPGPALAWHADTAYTEAPFEALSLHALDVVPGASSTKFVHAEQGLDRLPAALRARLETLEADMMSVGHGDLTARRCSIRDNGTPAYRKALPAVRVNGRTGRAYVAVSEMQTAGFTGIDWEEGRDLLYDVFDRLYAPEHVHEHFWHNGDLVIWDNLACQHARGALDNAGRRMLQRVIVGPQTYAAPHIRA